MLPLSAIPARTNAARWQVIAAPDGTLTDPTNPRKKYGYLFWEADRSRPYEIKFDECSCVASENLSQFLEESLETLGLNWRESNDFITYWLPQMQNNKFNLVRFLDREYTDDVELDITPKPDTLIRVFMVFLGSEDLIETTPPKLVKAERKGFVAVEWGGMNLDESPQRMQP